MRVDNWEDAAARGFTAEPANGYVFTAEDAQAGEKTVTISNGSAQAQTFTVKVYDYDAMIPQTIVLKDAGTGEQLAAIQIDQAVWHEESGVVRLRDPVTIPAKYEGSWTAESFTVEIMNQAGQAIDPSLYSLGKDYYGSFEISFPAYQQYLTYGGSVTFDGERFTGFANMLRTDEEGTGGDTAPEEGSVPETGADNASVPQTVQNMERNDEAAPTPGADPDEANVPAPQAGPDENAPVPEGAAADSASPVE